MVESKIYNSNKEIGQGEKTRVYPIQKDYNRESSKERYGNGIFGLHEPEKDKQNEGSSQQPNSSTQRIIEATQTQK